MSHLNMVWVWIYVICSAAYPAVYGQFPQAIPQPVSAMAPAQREGKISATRVFTYPSPEIYDTNWTIQQEILLENTFYHWDS